jgi:exocyst complex component 7
MSGLTAQRARNTEALQAAMAKMDTTTKMAYRCCEQLAHRARHLDSLTSPASDASSMLSRANANLAATLVLLKEAREKFDTIADCEPSLERLHKGVETMERHRKENSSSSSSNTKGGKGMSGGSSVVMAKRIILTEQDVYAAGDSMEILRDAYAYFCKRRSWRSTPDTLAGLERIYTMGEDAMALLISLHLKAAGQGVRPKHRNKAHAVAPHEETAEQVRRLPVLTMNTTKTMYSAFFLPACYSSSPCFKK